MEKLPAWIMENIATLSAIVVALIALVRKILILREALKQVMGVNEGAAGKDIREKNKANVNALEKANKMPSVVSTIRNFAAVMDSDPEKKPSTKDAFKELVPDIARTLGVSLISKLFRGRKTRK